MNTKNMIPKRLSEEVVRMLANANFRSLAEKAAQKGQKYFLADVAKGIPRQLVVEAVRYMAERIVRRRDQSAAVDALKERPGRIQNIYDSKKERKALWQQKYAEAAVGLPVPDATDGTYRLGDVLVTVERRELLDWNRYSNSWHRQYGPAKTIETSLKVERWNDKTWRPETQVVALARTGNMDRRVTEAIATYLDLPKQKGQAGLRIHPCITLNEVASPHKRCRVYARYLAGTIVSYVAVRRGQHYHDISPETACDGVTRKLAFARIRGTTNRIVGLDTGKPVGKLLRGFGFCREGTSDALHMLELEDRQYTVSELLTAARWERLPQVAAKYPAEVGVVAKHAAKLPELPGELEPLLQYT